MDYDRTHQSPLESKYKAQKQNGTFLSLHPLVQHPLVHGTWKHCIYLFIVF